MSLLLFFTWGVWSYLLHGCHGNFDERRLLLFAAAALNLLHIEDYSCPFGINMLYSFCPNWSLQMSCVLDTVFFPPSLKGPTRLNSFQRWWVRSWRWRLFPRSSCERPPSPSSSTWCSASSISRAASSGCVLKHDDTNKKCNKKGLNGSSGCLRGEQTLQIWIIWKRSFICTSLIVIPQISFCRVAIINSRSK